MIKESLKFNQYTIFSKENKKNKEGEIFLREYKYFYSYIENKNEPILHQYAIWIDELNISHIRNSEHLFINCTWYSPNGYAQILIILHKDKIINEKIPGCFIITNNKKYDKYLEVLNAFNKIMTQNGVFDFNLSSITTDSEIELTNAIKNAFPNIKLFYCYFHYKQNLVKNLRKRGLLKKSNVDQYNASQNFLNILGKLPLVYNGDIKIIKTELEKIKEDEEIFADFVFL